MKITRMPAAMVALWLALSSALMPFAASATTQYPTATPGESIGSVMIGCYDGTKWVPALTSGQCLGSGGGGGSSAGLGLAPSGNTTLAVSSSSARVALPNTDANILIDNRANTVDVHVKLGNGSVTAALTDTVVPAAGWIVLAVGSNTNLAAIVATGTPTITIVQGTGLPALGISDRDLLTTLHNDLVTLNGTAGNPLAVQGGAVWIGNVGQNGAPWTFSLNATPTLANGNGVVPTQGGAVLSQTNPSFAAITDGTNKAAVKAASTPAAAADPSLVSQVNPGQPEITGHFAEIGSNQIKVDVAQTVTASAYAGGNALGGLMTIANAARISAAAGSPGTGGILTGLQLNSKALQSGVQVDIFIFDANPTGSTCTDKTAFVIANADFNKVVGIMTIPSTPANGAGWFGATTTGAVGIPTYFPVAFDLASATSIYACAVVRAAITPGSTSDISFKFNILRN